MGKISLILFIGVQFICGKTNAQNNSHSIEYKFDSAIVSLITNEIQYEITIRNDTFTYKDFCIELSYYDSTIVYEINLNNGGIIGELCKKTNRYIQINNYIIPVFFNYDFDFAEMFIIPNKFEKNARINTSGHLFGIYYNKYTKALKIHRS